MSEIKRYIKPLKKTNGLTIIEERFYVKSEVDAVIAHQKFKRCLLYAKNHKNLGDLATDTIRLIGLNAYAFTKETETACVAYWNRIRDCHYRHHNEWLELAEKFKP